MVCIINEHMLRDCVTVVARPGTLERATSSIGDAKLHYVKKIMYRSGHILRIPKLEFIYL